MTVLRASYRTADGLALLRELAARPEGAKARELGRAIGWDGVPSPRLNVLAKDGLVVVDTHEGKWAITHAGFDVATDELPPDEVSRLIRLWPDDCACASCVEFRSGAAS